MLMFKYKTKKQVLEHFNIMWQEMVKDNLSLDTDIVAKCEAWNNFTDSLCKDGLITLKQYNNWSNPF